MVTLCGCDIIVPLLLHTCRTVHFLLRHRYLTHTCDFDDCQNLQENTFMMSISIFISATSSSASSVSLSQTPSPPFSRSTQVPSWLTPQTFGTNHLHLAFGPDRSLRSFDDYLSHKQVYFLMILRPLDRVCIIPALSTWTACLRPQRGCLW